MRRYYLQSGLWMSALTVLILGGLYVAADLNATDRPSNALNIEGEFWNDTDLGFALDKISPRSTKIPLGSNSTATVTIDLIPDGGTGNQIDDVVTSGTVSGQGTKIAVEVFAKGVTTSLRGVQIEFDFDASVLKFDKAENSAFLFAIPEPTGVNFAATSPVTLPSTGFLARAEFSTVADVTGRDFTLGIKAVTLAESSASSDVITTTDVISFNANPSPDFDGDGTVGFSDFLAFAGQYGARQGDGQYEARYDLDSDGAISFSDFLIFASSFGKEVPPSGGGSTSIVDIPDANLRAVIADSLDKASGAPITRAEMATLTRIDAQNKGIRNLTGLEHATNLQILGLGRVRVNDELVNSNDISNLSPLSNLTNLEILDLNSNSISDISALSNLTNLDRLYLRENSISDISALSNLTNLTILNLNSNSISDISILSNLTNLTGLGLNSNSISDISILSNLTNLTGLGLGGNSISDISALSNLTNLTGLGLGGNSISDISALSNLTNLTILDLNSNSISDISILSNLTNLTGLGLGGNSISDISALSNLTNLTILVLGGNSISDISPLVANTGLGSGDEVDLRSNPLSSTSINTHIPVLQDRGVTVEFDGSSGSGGSGSNTVPRDPALSAWINATGSEAQRLLDQATICRAGLEFPRDTFCVNAQQTILVGHLNSGEGLVLLGRAVLRAGEGGAIRSSGIVLESRDNLWVLTQFSP